MSISDIKLRTAKPSEKPYKITDSGGLYLVVSPIRGEALETEISRLWTRKNTLLGALSGAQPERCSREAAREQLAKGAGVSRLFFGSAIVPECIHSNGEVYLGIGFHMLLPFPHLFPGLAEGRSPERAKIGFIVCKRISEVVNWNLIRPIG